MNHNKIEIFPNPFLLTGLNVDPSNVALAFQPLQIKETDDSNGDLIKKEYFTDYNLTGDRR